MARDPAQIQADIALTRRVIETRLDALSRKVPREWWTPWALGAGALVLGLVMSRLPFLKLVGVGARTVQTGLTVAGTVAAVDRFLAEQRRLAA
jgi:uncharacterized protein DUF3618